MSSSRTVPSVGQKPSQKIDRIEVQTRTPSSRSAQAPAPWRPKFTPAHAPVECRETHGPARSGLQVTSMSDTLSHTGSVGQGSDRRVRNDVQTRTLPVSEDAQAPPPWKPTCTVTHSRPSLGTSHET